MRRLRGRHLLALDTVGVMAASIVALAFRYDPFLQGDQILALLPAVLVLMLVVRSTVDIAMGLYGRDWRYASVGDLQQIAAAAAVGSAIAATVVFASIVAGLRFVDSIPRGYWPIELFLTLFVVGGLRFAIRVAADRPVTDRSVARADRRATLLYGAGRVGVLMARSAQRNLAAGVDAVGFLDDDRSLAGTRVASLRVFGGLDALERAVAETGATTLLITMPSAQGNVVRRVVDAAMALGLDVRTVPAIEHLLDGTVDAYRVRRVRVEDLLRRPSMTEHAPEVRDVFQGRTVLITGAGGSIGSELARQVHAVNPARIILLDRAESALYLVQRDLEERASLGQGSGDVQARLGNVVSRPAMARLIATEKPDVILHAAAYKHVPMMEEHPSDAVQVNVGGTLALLDAAAAAGVERFVLVSTDKAVRPSSVMGASKRIAEMLVADTARRTGRPYVAVRFGNVLGSAGSVVPIFQEQLENGRPLTITDPEMTRFFMTIPEAAWLILDAAALGETGDLFVLDMGEPVNLMDLARDVTRLAGRDPDSQPMDFIGLRPGEKLHEELFYADEQVQPTSAPKVMRARTEPPPSTIRDQVRDLQEMANGEREDDLRLAIHASARGLPVQSSEEDVLAAARILVPVDAPQIQRLDAPQIQRLDAPQTRRLSAPARGRRGH